MTISLFIHSRPYSVFQNAEAFWYQSGFTLRAIVSQLVSDAVTSHPPFAWAKSHHIKEHIWLETFAEMLKPHACLEQPPPLFLSDLIGISQCFINVPLPYVGPHRPFTLRKVKWEERRVGGRVEGIVWGLLLPHDLLARKTLRTVWKKRLELPFLYNYKKSRLLHHCIHCYCLLIFSTREGDFAGVNCTGTLRGKRSLHDNVWLANNNGELVHISLHLHKYQDPMTTTVDHFSCQWF